MLGKICKLGVLMLAIPSRWFPRWDPWEMVRFLQSPLIFFLPSDRNRYLPSRNDNHIQEQINAACYNQYGYFGWPRQQKKPFIFCGIAPVMEVSENQRAIRRWGSPHPTFGGNSGLKKFKRKFGKKLRNYLLRWRIRLLMPLNILLLAEFLWALFEARFYFLYKRVRPTLPES